MSAGTDIEHAADRLAHVLVDVGLGLRAGQDLFVHAPIEAVPLVRAVIARAYRAGARQVHAFYRDDAATALRYRHAPDPSFDAAPDWLNEATARAISDHDGALLHIVGGDPDLLAGQDAVRVGRLNRAQTVASQATSALLRRSAMNWSIGAWPTPAWARAVFGDAPDAEARLLDAILAASRADQPDPVAAWRAHVAGLHARTAILNEKRYAALHFRAPGTDLRVGLADAHRWRGGAIDALNGTHCVPNVPTEEVFTMPHRDRVDGVVSGTKPLSYGGTLIEGIVMRFEAGRCVDARARAGQDVLRRLLEMDAGAAHLGEVALVPDASPISRGGVLFRNTLFDENAACHIAVGQSLMINTEGDVDAETLAARGGNSSLTHVDWMIGSAALDVDGITPAGEAEPMMRAGAWVGALAA